jgi:hypothetical protein
MSVQGGTKKKLVIKPFKEAPQLPSGFEDQLWTKLQAALQAIHRKAPAVDSKEELCRAVEDACLLKMAPSLYGKLHAECKRLVFAAVDSLKDQVRRCINNSLTDNISLTCLTDSEPG